MAVTRPAKLPFILNSDDTGKLILPNVIPETMELMDEVTPALATVKVIPTTADNEQG